MTVNLSAASDAVGTHRIGAIAAAGAIGTIIEWYDFLIYGTAAALVFNTLFFPNVDPRIGTLAALGSFTIGSSRDRSAARSSAILAIAWAASRC